LSSTKVRAALKAKNHAALASALSPDAAELLLSPSETDFQKFAKDYHKLGITSVGGEMAGDASAPAGPPRQILISLSALIREFDKRGEALLRDISPNALFFFGSKRSWVFPANVEEFQESRSQNRACTSGITVDQRGCLDCSKAKYQPILSLIQEKETRGEVFFLKPPWLQYNGNLLHGDRDAFTKASDWLVGLTDPVTCEKYKPLRLDEAWWMTQWDRSNSRYTDNVKRIVTNFSCGAHDYDAVMELLHQSNPTLDIVML